MTATFVLGGSALTLLAGCAKSATPHPFGAAGPSPVHVTPPTEGRAATDIPPPPPPPALATNAPGGVQRDVLDVGGRDLVFITVNGTSATPSADLPAQPVTPAAEVVVEVKPGQTLFAIAREHLGNGGRWRELVDANPGLDPLSLKAGQKIRIPQ